MTTTETITHPDGRKATIKRNDFSSIWTVTIILPSGARRTIEDYDDVLWADLYEGGWDIEEPEL